MAAEIAIEELYDGVLVDGDGVLRYTREHALSLAVAANPGLDFSKGEAGLRGDPWFEEFMQRYYSDYETRFSCLPAEGALGGLQAMANADIPLAYLSMCETGARPGSDDWLQRYGFKDLFKENIFYGNPFTDKAPDFKADIARQYGSRLIIEDSLKVAEAVARATGNKSLFVNKGNKPVSELVIKVPDCYQASLIIVQNYLARPRNLQRIS